MCVHSSSIIIHMISIIVHIDQTCRFNRDHGYRPEALEVLVYTLGLRILNLLRFQVEVERQPRREEHC